MRTRPDSPSSADRTASFARRIASRTSVAGPTSARPLEVNFTDRVVRSRSRVPNSLSSCLMVLLRGGCATCSLSAARPKCSSSATARKAIIWLISTGSPLTIDTSVSLAGLKTHLKQQCQVGILSTSRRSLLLSYGPVGLGPPCRGGSAAVRTGHRGWIAGIRRCPGERPGPRCPWSARAR
jgi:hypothetical protein